MKAHFSKYKNAGILFLMIFFCLAPFSRLFLIQQNVFASENKNLEMTLDQSNQLLSDILATYVKNGWVNYRDLSQDTRLKQYINMISQINPEKISSQTHKLAFWINAYNAYTLKVIVDNYPVKSISQLHSGGLIIGSVLKKTVWDKPFVTIDNKKITLNHIEHKIIRQQFNEPRIHFVLVCAAKSCPPLRSEAFIGAKLEEQLSDQARVFLNDASKNSFNLDMKKAELSSILSWYMKDFGTNKEQLLKYIAPYFPEDIAQSLLSETKEWKVKYKKYDWSLNGQ